MKGGGVNCSVARGRSVGDNARGAPHDSAKLSKQRPFVARGCVPGRLKAVGSLPGCGVNPSVTLAVSESATGLNFQGKELPLPQKIY
jgi:hypothetical protein